MLWTTEDGSLRILDFCTYFVEVLKQVVAKKLDRRLNDLGGKPIIERGLGDDQHPSGFVFIRIFFPCIP